MTIDDRDIRIELETLCEAYERALGDNDLAALDGFFWDEARAVRLGMGENLFGIDEIREFRKGREGGSPPREVLRTQITSFGRDFATSNVVFRRIGSQVIGRQSQCWVRFAEGWRIVSAHVSMMQGHA